MVTNKIDKYLDAMHREDGDVEFGDIKDDVIELLQDLHKEVMKQLRRTIHSKVHAMESKLHSKYEKEDVKETILQLANDDLDFEQRNMEFLAEMYLDELETQFL